MTTGTSWLKNGRVYVYKLENELWSEVAELEPPVVEIPAFFFLGFWFLIQFLSGAATIGRTSALSGGVAWWAHIGGFLVGMLLLKLLLPRDSVRRPVIV